MLKTGVQRRPYSGRQASQMEHPYLAELQASSHRVEVQEVIRKAIRNGTIRVLPIPGCWNRVRIVPVDLST
ncbi:MAG: hypothetical protein NVSMB9_20260 [Isosphaeraceae bacterium]